MDGPETSLETDAALMCDVRRGDVRQLAVLFERHHRKLFGFFVRMTGDREASEDLVQEVFLRILKYRKTFRADACFRTWMYQIARNVRIDHADRDGRRALTVVADLDLLGPVAGPEDLARRQETEILQKALSRLPPDKREVLLLARFEGLTHGEIGAVVGCDPATVRVRVFRAVDELRKIFFRMTGEKTLWNAHR